MLACLNSKSIKSCLLVKAVDLIRVKCVITRCRIRLELSNSPPDSSTSIVSSSQFKYIPVQLHLHFSSEMLPAVFLPIYRCSLLHIQEQELPELQRGISDSWNRNILLCLQCCLEDELWLVLRAVQSLLLKAVRALSSQHSLVEGAKRFGPWQKSPKGLFKPIDSHWNWPQAAGELLSWPRCWLYALCLCGCEDRFHLSDSWDGIETALFPKTYQRECYWLIEVGFSHIGHQPGAFPRCDLCLSLKF